MESYEKLKSKHVEVSDLIQWHFLEILKTINRRLIFKEKFQNPWTITISERVNKSVFIPLFQAIRDHKVHHQLSVIVRRDRLGHGEYFQIIFKHLGEFVFHLSKLCVCSRDDVKAYLFKISTNDRNAEIKLTPEKPGTIEYHPKKSRMTIKFLYEVKNKYIWFGLQSWSPIFILYIYKVFIYITVL